MTEFVDGHDITLLESGVEYFPALEGAIEDACREIYLETYIFDDDETGRRIAAALCRAARRGVVVRVLVDGFGGRPFVASLMPVLEAAGVAVQIYRRELGFFSLRRHRLRRLHRKIVAIDGAIAFVGGINVINDIVAGRYDAPRHDYAVRVQGPLLRPIIEAVHRLWWLVSWASLKRRRQRRPWPTVVRDEPAGPLRAAFLTRDNLGHRRDIEDAYLEAIEGAREEIVIASAYFFPGRRFRQALTDAAARGVRVTLLLQGLTDHPVLMHATRALYPYFLARGIRLFEYHRSELHAKVAVVDNAWATVGSSNIDPFSLLLAREANIVVADQGFARELNASLHRAIAHGATELHRDGWRRLPALRRLATWFAYQFVRLAIGLAGYRGKH